jgi:hypothetical protein
MEASEETAIGQVAHFGAEKMIVAREVLHPCTIVAL